MLPAEGGAEARTVLWSELCLKAFGMWVYKDQEMQIIANGDHLRVRARPAIVTTLHFDIEDHNRFLPAASFVPALV